MIMGSVIVTPRAVQTHRDSYLLAHLSVVSVRRPFLPTALIFSGGGIAFALAFSDLLYLHEIAFLAGGICLALLTGLVVGQIQLLSRDLRGSELSGMVWGSYRHLNRLRREIVRVLQYEGGAT
ncbi:hypothetical protein SAMN05421538_11437 [Paracoccus isoporae]|uniref:Uncharacterized protein n=1 Tax=Paracoccus isoporae TaxID=591205 RepID=A0A1G7GQN4_9RHOB|nr:hypothetical protein [Paracoccus isoporae]SDE90279.1 hypothetical protein SAMN05421538_11437 [Paracoccus isoporae]